MNDIYSNLHRELNNNMNYMAGISAMEIFIL